MAIESQEGVGGARRNRTADNGFADHCLTTWRPRHRTKGDLERRRPRRGRAPAVQFPALEQKLPPLCSASCGDRLLLTGASFVDDGRTDEVAPFGPRTVVVTNVTVAQEILQDEPGVRTALTDAAVGDDLVLAGNAFRLVELLQVVQGFEGAVFVGSLNPRNVGRAGKVSGTLGGFRHARRGDDFAGELINGTDVDKLPRFAALHDGEDLLFIGAKRFIAAGYTVGCGLDVHRFLREGALLFQPFLAAAVNQADIPMTVVLQLPEGVGGEPVVVVAIEQDGGVVGNAGRAKKLFESGLVDQIAADVVLELGLPIPADSAGDVALIVGGGVDVHFDQTEIGGVQVLSDPIG